MKPLKNKLLGLGVAGLLAMCGGMATATPASAATPHCVGNRYSTFAMGGCDGNGTPGRDRLVLECKGPQAYMVWYKGSWHDRYADWQDYLHCNTWETAYYVTFDHQG